MIRKRRENGGMPSESITDCFHRFFSIDEASGGDPQAAKLRLESLDGIRELEISEGFEQVEADIIALFRLPPKAVIDAAHLALAILHEMDYLLT